MTDRKKKIQASLGVVLIALAVAMKFGPFVLISKNAVEWAWALIATLGVVVLLIVLLRTDE